MKNISYLCKVKISIMKKFSFFYNDYSNPSVLGADKLWNNFSNKEVGDLNKKIDLINIFH